MSSLDEEFNPNRTTLKDYLRYLIDQVAELKEEQKQTQDKVSRLELDMERRNTLAEEKDKRNKGLWVIVGAIGGAVGFIVDKLIEAFTP